MFKDIMFVFLGTLLLTISDVYCNEAAISVGIVFTNLSISGLLVLATSRFCTRKELPSRNRR